MSKYKYKFYVSTNLVGSKIEDEIDLVNDWNYSKEELDSLNEEDLEKLVNDIYTEWIWNNINGGFSKID